MHLCHFAVPSLPKPNVALEVLTIANLENAVNADSAAVQSRAGFRTKLIVSVKVIDSLRHPL